MIVCKLKEVLKRKGWTRYKLHKRSGVTFPTIYMMYRSRSKLYSANVLEKLCRTLHCQVGDLIQREQNRYPRLRETRKARTK